MRATHALLLTALLFIVAATLSPTAALACGVHGSTGGNELWLPARSDSSNVYGRLLLESTLVAPTEPTTCVAGVGLGSDDMLAPSGLEVSGMSIVLFNTLTAQSTPVNAFSFAPNGTTTAGLAAGSGSSTAPGTNPLYPGASWFGFSSEVLPFVPPTPGPHEMLAFEFEVAVPAGSLPLSLLGQYAGGEGLTDGTPIFTSDHPVQYFTADDPAVVFSAPVPEPSALAVVVMVVFSVLVIRAPRRAEFVATAF